MIKIKLVFKGHDNSPATTARKEVEHDYNDEQWSSKTILAIVYRLIQVGNNRRGIYATMVRNSNSALFEQLEQCFKNGQRPNPVMSLKNPFLTIQLERA